MLSHGFHQILAMFFFTFTITIHIDSIASMNRIHIQLHRVFAIVTRQIKFGRRDFSFLKITIVIIDTYHSFNRTTHIDTPTGHFAIFIKVIIIKVTGPFKCSLRDRF